MQYDSVYQINGPIAIGSIN